jgi:type II secretory pathway component PulM
MRANYVMAVAIVLVCVGAKLTFLAAPIAEADSRSIASASVDVFRMQQNIENLQVQEVHDMTFVFPSPSLMI